MACPWWDDDDYNRVGRTRLEDQKGKSHEKDKGQIHEDHNKGKNHEGKMKEQKQPEKSYEQGYNTGYMKGYEDGYESGYEYGCENTTRDTKFGDGHSGTQDSGKKFEYDGYCTSGYMAVKSSENVEYHHGYELGHDHIDNEYDCNDVAGSHYQSHDGCWNNYNDDSD